MNMPSLESNTAKAFKFVGTMVLGSIATLVTLICLYPNAQLIPQPAQPKIAALSQPVQKSCNQYRELLLSMNKVQDKINAKLKLRK